MICCTNSQGDRKPTLDDRKYQCSKSVKEKCATNGHEVFRRALSPYPPGLRLVIHHPCTGAEPAETCPSPKTRDVTLSHPASMRIGRSSQDLVRRYALEFCNITKVSTMAHTEAYAETYGKGCRGVGHRDTPSQVFESSRTIPLAKVVLSAPSQCIQLRSRRSFGKGKHSSLGAGTC